MTAGSNAPEERIGVGYYDSSGYFEEGAEHLLDADSTFQRYRVSEVLRTWDPQPAERLLDLGCGWGTFTAALAPRVGSLVAADFSLKSLELTKRRLGLEGLEGSASVICADATRLPLADAAFDTVLAADLVEHLYPDQTIEALAECSRVLRRGGRLILWTPNPGHLFEWLRRRRWLLKPDPSHVDYKTLGRLRKLVQDAGLVVERSGYRPSHLTGFRQLELVGQTFLPFLRRRVWLVARKP